MTWHDDFQVWLSEEQSLENAQKIVNYFYGNSDWSKESLSAMIGNMRHESSVNPNMYEYGYDWEDDRGYGLVQWTPRSKYWDWAVNEGLDPEKGESQLARIDYEVENNIQWIPRSDYENMTFSDFRQNTGGWSVDYLTEAFTWGYERPNEQAGWDSMPDRKAFANRAFEELDWSGEGTDPTYPIPDVEIDFSPIFDYFDGFVGDMMAEIQKMIDDLIDEINSMLTKDIYKYGNSHTQGNNFLKITNQLENMYKIKPTINFHEILEAIIQSGQQNIFDFFDDSMGDLGDIIDNIEPEITFPPPDNGDSEKYFPVDFNADGINFWYPPYDSDLTANMDYGERTTGVFHYGYDIGGGGVNHDVYAVASGEIVRVETVSGYGYSIQINHSDDEYYSYYAHLVPDSGTVAVGDTIAAGEKIGVMGSSGGDYAIHLHFELSRNDGLGANGDTVDPKNYLGVTGNNSTNLPNPNS